MQNTYYVQVYNELWCLKVQYFYSYAVKRRDFESNFKAA